MQRFARLWPYQACACLGTTGAALYRHSLLETKVKFTQIKIKKFTIRFLVFMWILVMIVKSESIDLTSLLFHFLQVFYSDLA